MRVKTQTGKQIMRYRSWLIVPGDSERKLGKSLATGADVVVVDLEATVPLDAKPAARALAAEWLIAHRRQVLEQSPMARWVRINSLESRQWRDDLLAVLPGAPEGIILPGAAGPETVREIAAELYELEQSNHLAAGSIKILPLAGETPRSALTIASYAESTMPRLAGLGWSADSLGTALNAMRHRHRTARPRLDGLHADDWLPGRCDGIAQAATYRPSQRKRHPGCARG